LISKTVDWTVNFFGSLLVVLKFIEYSTKESVGSLLEMAGADEFELDIPLSVNGLLIFEAKTRKMKKDWKVPQTRHRFIVNKSNSTIQALQT
jgi:hypothetical protein